jgi:enamine deaminase RidA (YjgF/YER057c/UK114 family)
VSARRSFHLRAEAEKAFGYAQAVRHADQLHIAGSLSVDEAFRPLYPGDMAAQLRQVYATLGRTLEAFDAGFACVVSERIYVTDMEAFLAANSVRLEVYPASGLPATTAVEVRRLAFVECMVEVELIALL